MPLTVGGASIHEHIVETTLPPCPWHFDQAEARASVVVVDLVVDLVVVVVALVVVGAVVEMGLVVVGAVVEIGLVVVVVVDGAALLPTLAVVHFTG